MSWTLLAAIGIAGVVASTVAERSAEIGLRMALGARMAHVVGAVVKRLMGAVAGDVVLGLVALAALTPFIANQSPSAGFVEVLEVNMFKSSDGSGTVMQMARYDRGLRSVAAPA